MSHKKSPHRGSKSAEKGPKDCLREWVKSPLTDRWIEVDGAAWKKLYPQHKEYLESAERRTTPGRLKGDLCVVAPGDPPHGGGSRGRTSSPSRSGGVRVSASSGSRMSASSGPRVSASPRRSVSPVVSGRVGSRMSASPGRQIGPTIGRRVGSRVSPSRGYTGTRHGDRHVYVGGRSYPLIYRGGRPGYWYRRRWIPVISFGLPLPYYPMYDPYWWGPPCYGDRWCWENMGYRYGIDFVL